MATVVVPFRAGGKSRLPAAVRVDLALAMLGDVLEAAAAHAARVRLVTDDAAAAASRPRLGVEVIADPGGGQGAAVRGCARRGRRALPRRQRRPPVRDTGGARAASRRSLPRSSPRRTGRRTRSRCPSRAWFAPLYGAGSAARFARRWASSRPRSPSSSTTSTRSPTLERRSARAPGSAAERTLC